MSARDEDFIASLEAELLSAELDVVLDQEESDRAFLELLELLAGAVGRPVGIPGALNPKFRVVLPRGHRPFQPPADGPVAE